MTTIAWDGHTLAADSMGDQYGLRMPVRKLYEGRLACGTPFILGVSGEFSQGQMLLDWLGKRSRETITTAIYSHHNAGDNDPQAILVVSGGVAYCKIGAVFTPLPRKYHAIGSGRDFAIAAMALGLSAEEAVQLAIQFDCYSGGDIAVLAAPDRLVKDNGGNENV